MVERRITIHQGESHASDHPELVLTTVLGSCIAACLHDGQAGIGGLNHFLLPAPGEGACSSDDLRRYGVFSMELLVNALLTRGADRRRIRARLFGGANMHPGLRPIGDENAAFARNYLRQEGIVLVGEDTGGRHARRVEFRPADGLVRCSAVRTTPIERPAAVPETLGTVEFF